MFWGRNTCDRMFKKRDQVSIQLRVWDLSGEMSGLKTKIWDSYSWHIAQHLWVTSPRKHSRGIRGWRYNKHFRRDNSSRDSSRKEQLMGSRLEKVKVAEENQAQVLSLKSVKESARDKVVQGRCVSRHEDWRDPPNLLIIELTGDLCQSGFSWVIKEEAKL